VDTKYNVEEALRLAKCKMEKIKTTDARIIKISGETDMGLHATTESRKKFKQLPA
jgi:adenosylcobinamide kinase/adenosylcobinamide-phosphate guanylyltransferase